MPRTSLDSHELSLSNLDKVLYPEDGITKGEIIEYYLKISERMLPFIEKRPLSMERFPDGVDKEGFYQKEIPDHFPGWIERARIKTGHKTTNYAVCNDRATLVYLADQACITPHVWLSRIDKLDYPDRLIFDIDPGKKHDFQSVCVAALVLREMLEDRKISPYVMTTGKRGLHVVTPLDRSDNFDTVRAFAAVMADTLASSDPDRFTTEQRITKRKNKVFIDVLRNGFGATAAPPYSLRPVKGAPVATPLAWHELDDKKLRGDSFNIKNIFKRLEKTDPWSGILKKAYKIPG